MAQYVYDASLYPDGTTLADLGVPNGHLFIVYAVGSTGRKYWRMNAFMLSADMELLPDFYTDFDILLLCNLTPAENGTTFLNTRIKVDGSYVGYHMYVDTAPITYAGNLNTTKNTAPSNLVAGKAMATRFTFDSSQNMTVKVWTADVDGLEAAEPVTTNIEGTTNVIDSQKPLLWYEDSSPFRRPTSYTTISVGTDGDAAPYPQSGQTVSAPSGLTVSNITDAAADVDWI